MGVHEDDLVDFCFLPAASAGTALMRIRVCHRQTLTGETGLIRNGAMFPGHVHQCHLAGPADRQQTREGL